MAGFSKQTLREIIKGGVAPLERRLNKLECILEDDVSGDSGNVSVLLEQILEALNNQPQIEGLFPIRVCYEDGVSGYVAFKYNEVTNVVTTIWFDNIYQQVEGVQGIIVECPTYEIEKIEVCPPNN